MRASHPRPLAIVTGTLGSGKTTLIARLLCDPAMADTLVLVNEFGEVGLDHHLLSRVTDTVVLLPNGCLCCTVKADVLQTLRDMRRAWLAGDLPDVGRVVIETTGLAEPAPLIAALAGDPLIGDTVELVAVTTVIDGQHGSRQVEERATCRNQIRFADNLLLSKSDLVDDADIEALARRLFALNPLAGIGRSSAVGPDRLFGRDGGTPPRSIHACDEPSDHIDRISTLVLRPAGELRWRRFQIWLGGILESYGDRLLRLKGRLTFVDLDAAVIIQAVHHHFYPVLESPGSIRDDYLVLIVEASVETDLRRTIDSSVFELP